MADTFQCHFDTLSGELRNRIYSHFFAALLTPTQPTTIDIRTPYPQLTRNQSKTRAALALTASSRQLRAETLGLFWSKINLRINAGTLTAYSQPAGSVPGVHPMNRAHYINQDRAACLREWLARSGVAGFARLLRPIELDLGMWDPSSHADAHQFIVLRLLCGDAQDLTRQLRRLGDAGQSDDEDEEDDEDDDSDDNDSYGPDKKPATGCTLRFKVQVLPATALGSICVANERKQALATIAELCEGRAAKVQAQFEKGLLTNYGQFVLLNDMAMCRSLAELLVGYIVEEEQKQVDRGGNRGQVRKRSQRATRRSGL